MNQVRFGVNVLLTAVAALFVFTFALDAQSDVGQLSASSGTQREALCRKPK